MGVFRQTQKHRVGRSGLEDLTGSAVKNKSRGKALSLTDPPRRQSGAPCLRSSVPIQIERIRAHSSCDSVIEKALRSSRPPSNLARDRNNAVRSAAVRAAPSAPCTVRSRRGTHSPAASNVCSINSVVRAPTVSHVSFRARSIAGHPSSRLVPGRVLRNDQSRLRPDLGRSKFTVETRTTGNGARATLVERYQARRTVRL